jgi:hypothetical protein
MKLVRLDIAFDGKPRIPVKRDVQPAPPPAPPSSAGAVFRHAGILPIEWIDDSVACHVEVELDDTEGVTDPVVISARALEGTGEFGDLPSLPIPPSDLQTGRCTVRFPLTVAHLPVNGVRECFVQWDWRCSVGAAEFSLGVSDHLLFVTLAPPTTPWSIAAGPAMPFALALRTACRFGRGATKERSLVSQLFVAVRDLGVGSPPVQYGADVSDYTFRGPTSPQFFDCQELLRDLASTDADPIVLCCTEFACLMVALANVTGCATTRVMLQVGPNCHTFHTRPIRQLGQNAPQSSEFIRHEVCVISTGAIGSRSLVFDPPFLLSMKSGRHGFQPVNGMPMGSIRSGLEQAVYLSHLIDPRDLDGMDVFEPLPFLFQVPHPMPPPVACIEHRFRAIVSELSVEILPAKPVIDGFRLSGLEPLPPKARTPRNGAAQRRTFYRAPGGSRPLVQVDVWTTANQRTLIELLADYAARSEVAYRRADVSGVPTYVSSTGYAAIQLFQGGVVRLVRLSDAAPLAGALARDAAEMNPT